MKDIAKIIAFFIVLVLANACGINNISKQQIKSLDSLNGVINTAIINLQKIDTLQFKKALTQFDEYAQFINSKLNDTLSKNEAIDLKNFFESGEELKMFHQNKINLLSRLKIINTQVSHLCADISNKVISTQEANIHFKNEVSEANRLAPLAFEQEKLYYLNYQKLNQSIQKVEEIIKRYNQNQLPIVIANPN